MRRTHMMCFVFFVSACGSSTNQSGVVEDDIFVQDTSADVETTAEEDTAPEPECSADYQCDDEVECTLDKCNFGICQNLQKPAFCDDLDECTIDFCSSQNNVFGGCKYTQITCNDGDPCTNDTCDSTVGCVFSVAGGMCDDNNPCTQDMCEPQGCEHLPVVCDDGNIFTFDACSPNKGGCYHQVKECDDGFPCTHDDPCMAGACNLDFTCVFTKLTCDDGVECTADLCSGGECLYKTKNGLCNDGDGNICTQQLCDLNEGCVDAYLDCDDKKPYTLDHCDAIFGCVSTVIDGWCENANQCEDGNACMIGVCNPNNTCSYVAKICDDGIDCTQDSCDVNGYCTNIPDDEFCGTGLFCMDWGVGELGCVEGCKKDSECDNGLFCKNTICDYFGDYEGTPFTCIPSPWEPSPCYKGEQCNELLDECELIEGYCEDDEWCVSSQDPDDYCMQTTCVDNLCQVMPVGVAYPCGTLCGAGKCIEGECVPFEDSCNDNDVCTMDSCDIKNGCAHFVIEGCENKGSCSVLECNNLGQYETCYQNGWACDDKNPCTLDTCVEDVCTHEPVYCDDGDSCTSDFCSEGFGCGSTIPGGCWNGCSTQGNWDCAYCQLESTCDDYNSKTLDSCVSEFEILEGYDGNCVHTMTDQSGDELKNGVGFVCPNQHVLMGYTILPQIFGGPVHEMLANHATYTVGDILEIVLYNVHPSTGDYYGSLNSNQCACIDGSGRLRLPDSISSTNNETTIICSK